MIDSILRNGAHRFGDRVALVSSGTRWTYRELEDRSTALARALLARGVARGDRVGLHGFNSGDWVVAYHAIAKAGCVVTPLNALLTPEEVDFILRDCGAVAVLGSDGCLERLRSADAVPSVEHVSFASFDDLIGSAPAGDAAPPAAIDPDQLSTIGYTSGTTGHPKGAAQSHRAVVLNAALTATAHVRTANDVVVTALPAAHVYANAVMNSIFLAGGTVVLLERFEPAAVLDAIGEHRATLFEGVPAMYSMLEASDGWEAADLSSLRAATVGGQTISISVIEEWERRAQAPLLELWGMTEISGLGSTHPAYSPNVHGSIGVSLPSVDLRVCRLDEPTVEAAVGEPGELQVRGPIVMQGYYGNDEATKGAFTSDGWLLTGDVATFDRYGYYRIVDRRKDLILTGGYNVYPAEVERVVAGCPGVALVAVGPVADDVLGEVPKAYVVRKGDHPITVDDVLAHCKVHLASYKVPKQVAFVEELPRNSTGKLLRRELRKLDG